MPKTVTTAALVRNFDDDRQAPAMRQGSIGAGTFWKEHLMRSTITRRQLAVTCGHGRGNSLRGNSLRGNSLRGNSLRGNSL